MNSSPRKVKKSPAPSVAPNSAGEITAPQRTLKQRRAEGKALRAKVSRESHADWNATQAVRDPIAILEKSNQDRLQNLVPLRFGRMLRSPFTFLRGSAALMAHDLAQTPQSGLRVQACGDCHLLNFGLFATPERNLVFDLNDFDETLPAPWEWDVKRLAVSFAVAGRDNRLSRSEGQTAVRECVRAYREHMSRYSRMSALEVWYDRISSKTLIDMAPDEKARATRQRAADKAQQRIGENLFPKIAAETVHGRHQLVDQPPVLFHVPLSEDVYKLAMANYRTSLPDHLRNLLDRYHLEDFAVKVVGIGSVGTRCLVGLYFDETDHPLLLQVKEACRSVLEPYAGKSLHDNQGHRVVTGQRLMQSSSDIFLGWTRSKDGHDYFVRQLRDMKFSMPVEGMTGIQLKRYAEVCGWTLARAHARSGDAGAISGYLGKGDSFDDAMSTFADAYANQNEKDHAALVEAVRSGRVEVLRED